MTIATVADDPLAYAELTAGEQFAVFCREVLEHSVDSFAGTPVELEPWQRDFMDEALAHDSEGIPYWRSVVLVLPRKNGKTTLLAAFALYRLLYDEGYPEILLAAASDKQAGRLFDSVVAFIRRSEVLVDLLIVRDYVGEIARRDGEGKIFRMSSSPERLHGYNPSLVVCDEVARWVTPQLRRSWAALTSGGGARSSAQVFTISTAGEAHTRTEGILGRIIDGNEEAGDLERRHEALTISRNHPAQTVVYNYSAPTMDRRDIAKIKLANPASWITDEFLRRQSHNPELTASEFLQLHACVWAETDDQWLALDVWRSLAGGRDSAPGDEIAIGFDGGRFDDSTVLVGCRIEDGHVFVIDSWEKPEGGGSWEVSSGDVDVAVYEAFQRYKVRRFYADPPYWQTELASWARDFGSVVVEWPTNRPRQMGAAVERFRTDVLAGRLTHDDSALLRRHVANARMRKTRAGYWLEKDTKYSQDKIDGAIAAVLAYEARCDAVAAGTDAPATVAFL